MTETSNEEVSFRDTEIDLPGARLKVARERFHFALEDIARSMHLKPEVVDAVERDDYAALKRSSVFIRGYIRGYAKLVDLPADDLIAAYNHHFAPQPEIEAEAKPSLKGHRHHIGSRDKPIRWILYVIIAGVIAAGALWWNSQKMMDTSPSVAVVEEQPAAETEVLPADKDALPHSHDTLQKHNSFVIKERKEAEPETSLHPSKQYRQNFKID